MKNNYLTEQELNILRKTLDVNERIYQICEDIKANKDLVLLEELIDTYLHLKLPSKHEIFRPGKEVELKYKVVRYMDIDGNIKDDFIYFGGTLNLILKAGKAKFRNHSIFFNLKEEIKKSLVNDNNTKSKTINKMYDFLTEHFELSATKEEFLNNELMSEIVLKQKNTKLSKKDITKSMIGVLFNFITSDFEYLKHRLCFLYIKRNYQTEIDYSEANRAYKKDKSKKKDLPYKKFEDNLNRAYRLFAESEK